MLAGKPNSETRFKGVNGKGLHCAGTQLRGYEEGGNG